MIRKCAWYLAEILRQGGMIDLGPPQKLQQVETNLLASFFAGVGRAQLLCDQQLLETLESQDLGGK